MKSTTDHLPERGFSSETDYKAAIEKIHLHEAEKTWSLKKHWQMYGRLSFASTVDEEYARQCGVRFVESLGSGAYGIVFYGRASEGGRAHIHVTLGGLWSGRLASGHGLDLVALNIRRVRKKWKHGWATLDMFNREKWTTYAFDHHEYEIVGTPKRYRDRHRRTALITTTKEGVE